jgi:hypothetical protein
MANTQQLTLENVRVIFPNFGGRVTDHNKLGSREFSALLDPEVGAELASQGWNVKFPAEDKPNQNTFLPVTLSNGPTVQPWIKIVLVNNGHGTIVQPDDVEQLAMLDNVTPGARANLILNPYNWTVGSSSGIKAYVKKIYIYLDDVDPEFAPHMEEFERDINYL